MDRLTLKALVAQKTLFFLLFLTLEATAAVVVAMTIIMILMAIGHLVEDHHGLDKTVTTRRETIKVSFSSSNSKILFHGQNQLVVVFLLLTL